MSDDEGIQWVIDKLNVRYGQAYQIKRKYNSNHYVKEARRLKLCPNCEQVWEIGHTGTVRRYDHLPTYKLNRVVCTFCKRILNDKDEEE